MEVLIIKIMERLSVFSNLLFHIWVLGFRSVHIDF
jgi:hypothetical protein